MAADPRSVEYETCQRDHDAGDEQHRKDATNQITGEASRWENGERRGRNDGGEQHIGAQPRREQQRHW